MGTIMMARRPGAGYHYGGATVLAGRCSRRARGRCIGRRRAGGLAVMVGAGEAVVITQFGDPVRVLTAPGLAWKVPAPVQSTIPVDLRLRTTSTGLQDVGTRDGLRILVQAYVAWQVPPRARPVGAVPACRAQRSR